MENDGEEKNCVLVLPFEYVIVSVDSVLAFQGNSLLGEFTPYVFLPFCFFYVMSLALQYYESNEPRTVVVSGFHCSVNEIFNHLEYYTA